MKKISLIATFVSAVFFSHAQDIEQVKTFAYLGQAQKAKDALDKYMANEKNAKKPEGWYYKGYVLNMLSKDSTKSAAESSTLKAEAFEAYKKYRTMDPKTPLLAEQTNSPLFDLYVGYSSELGVKAYNAKDNDAAFNAFKKALEIHDYIYSNNIEGANGFKFSQLDTTLVTYAAITAQEAKKMDSALPFYQKLVDAGVTDKQYLDVYKVLAEQYRTKKDEAKLKDVLAKGRKAYPAEEEYWMAVEIDDAIQGIKKPELFTKYDELIAAHPGNYMLDYNYGIELYQYIYSDSAKGQDLTKYKDKLVETLKNAIAVKSTVEANFLLSNFLYNNSIDISDEARKIKGVKPDDVKKKKDLNAASTKSMDDAIPYAQAVEPAFKALTKPKNSEKVNYKQAMTILKNIYESKKDVAKTAEYDKKVKEAE